MTSGATRLLRGEKGRSSKTKSQFFQPVSLMMFFLTRVSCRVRGVLFRTSCTPVFQCTSYGNSIQSDVRCSEITFTVKATTMQVFLRKKCLIISISFSSFAHTLLHTTSAISSVKKTILNHNGP